MLFAKISADGAVLKWPVKEDTLRRILGNVTLPAVLTDESLAETGFVCVNPVLKADLPRETKDQKIQLGNTLVQRDGRYTRCYELVDVPAYVKPLRLARKWKQVRSDRDQRMTDFDWRIARHERQVRLGQTPTDDIAVLDAYMQALADITQCDDPFLVEFPAVPA